MCEGGSLTQTARPPDGVTFKEITWENFPEFTRNANTELSGSQTGSIETHTVGTVKPSFRAALTGHLLCAWHHQGASDAEVNTDNRNSSLGLTFYGERQTKSKFDR